MRQIPHYRGKCPEPYTREEVLEEKFTALLNQISFSPEVLNWVEEPLHESHHDERKFHLGDRATPARAPPCAGSINAMYMDKLDGRIDNEFFDRKAGDFRTEQLRIMGDIAAHQNANQTYIEEGVRPFALADRATIMFADQPPAEKRKLLDCVVSSC